MSGEPERLIKTRAKTLACLRPGYVTVFVGYGLGMANGGVPTEVSMDLIPFDLRRPNAEFMVVLDRSVGRVIGVERNPEVE